MEQDVKVSVICNAFNHEKYIRDALDGFVNQKTDFKFEVLIHDDASTDNTANIIREYEAKYPDIIKPIYQTENQYSKGVKITKDIQMPRVKYKYVAICEGDDYWTDPLKLQKQYDFLENNPDYSMCVCSTVWLNMLSGKQENRCVIKEDMDIPVEDIIVESHGRIFQNAAIFIKADICKQFPEWRQSFPIGDFPLAVLAGLNGKVRMLADTMTVYRWYSQNSWTARMDNDEIRIKISERMIDGLEKLDKATNGEYSDAIALRIKRHKYLLAVTSHNLKEIRSKELRSIHKSKSLHYRASLYIRCAFPTLYSKILKPLGRRLNIRP